MGFLSFLILPLLIFVIVDTFASLNVALVVALVVAIGEFAYSFFVSGEIDSFSVFSLFLLLVLGGLSYFKQSRKMFYLKPAVLSFAMGGFLLVCYLAGKDVLVEMLERMAPLLAPEQAELLNSPKIQSLFKVAPLTLGIACLIHGSVATYAALKMNRWGWFLVAGLGGYFFIFLGAIGASLLI